MKKKIIILSALLSLIFISLPAYANKISACFVESVDDCKTEFSDTYDQIDDLTARIEKLESKVRELEAEQ